MTPKTEAGKRLPSPEWTRALEAEAAEEARHSESPDDETEALLRAYFDARRAAILNVVAHKASPVEYPGLALVPVSDIERLEQFVEVPRTRLALLRGTDKRTP